MNCFVTGGTGFIGARTVRHLVGKGHNVTTHDLTPELSFIQELMTREELKSVRIVTGDVTDLPALLRALKQSKAQRSSTWPHCWPREATRTHRCYSGELPRLG